MSRLVKINWGDGAYDLIEVNTDEEVSLINKMINESAYLVGERILDDICKKVPSAKVITEEVFEIETDVHYFSDDEDEFESDSDDYPDYEEQERNEWRDYADETFYTDVVSDIKWIEWPAEDVTVSVNRIGDDKNGATKS